MKFILSRTDDYAIHSKKWIVGYGLLFWLISRIFAMLLIIGCVAIYNANGINPEDLTKFAGNPETAKNLGSSVYVYLTIFLVAPLLEECIFRLGLSFRRWQISIAVASIPLYILWQHINRLTIGTASIYVLGAIAVFLFVFYFTNDTFWREQKLKYFRSTVWLSAIAFGLIHLIAFSAHSLILLPYMLCITSVPFFAGCAVTYYRINLGFWWGVGLHIFNNLPAIFLMI